MTRIRLDDDRPMRNLGIGLFLVALVPLSIAALVEDSGPRLGFAVVAAVLAGIAWLLFRPRNLLEIDAASGTVVVTRGGTRDPARPIATLGPVEVRERTRYVETRSGSVRRRRMIVEYVVRVNGPGQLDVWAFRHPEPARRRAESFARTWKLPMRSLGGEERAADELDLPLHRRLRRRPQEQPRNLLPEWKVRVERRGHGFAVVSSRWDPLLLFVPLVQIAATAAVAIFLVREGAGGNFPTDVAGVPMATVLAGLVGVVTVARLPAIYDAVRPGELVITHEGARYRWRTMSLEEIEEVSWRPRLEIVGDRRQLRLSRAFCDVGAAPHVVHEIERCLVIVGEGR